jgi:hypothetical protein
MHNSTMVLSGEGDAGLPPKPASADLAKPHPAPAADAAPAFRWWTFAVLAVYTVSLLVFCGFVTLQKYSPVDALQGGSIALSPAHLPIAPFRVAHVVQDGEPLRMVCYQVSD